MKKEKMSANCSCPDMSACTCKGHGNPCSSSGAIYGLGVVGALFYFLTGATTFGAVMLGIGKAIVWPALVMFKVLTMLQM